MRGEKPFDPSSIGTTPRAFIFGRGKVVFYFFSRYFSPKTAHGTWVKLHSLPSPRRVSHTAEPHHVFSVRDAVRAAASMEPIPERASFHHHRDDGQHAHGSRERRQGGRAREKAEILFLAS